MSPETLLVWVNRIYVGAGVVTVFATAITVFTGLKQLQINAQISGNKDRELTAYKVNADKDRDIAALKIQDGAIKIAELQERLQWRKLEERQSNLLCKEIEKQKGNVHLEWIQNDIESQTFAERIGKIFESCGWTTTNMPITPQPTAFFDLSIQDKYNGPQASFVREAFDKAGIHYRTDLPQFSGTSGPLAKPGDVKILVGSKPSPELSISGTNSPTP